jgi:hypothetical protein
MFLSQAESPSLFVPFVAKPPVECYSRMPFASLKRRDQPRDGRARHTPLSNHVSECLGSPRWSSRRDVVLRELHPGRQGRCDVTNGWLTPASVWYRSPSSLLTFSRRRETFSRAPQWTPADPRLDAEEPTVACSPLSDVARFSLPCGLWLRQRKPTTPWRGTANRYSHRIKEQRALRTWSSLSAMLVSRMSLVYAPLMCDAQDRRRTYPH